MYLKKHFFITLALILIYACKSSDNSQYNFDPRTIKGKEITLSEISDFVTYVPLENTILIGNIGHIKFINQSIYFYSNEGIVAFDRVKKQLTKIGSLGRGPGEYLDHRHFTVDEKTETVYDLDIGDIVKTYSRSGQFLRSFPIQRNGSSASIDFFESKLFVSYALQYENAKYSWIVFDTLGNVIKKRESGIPIFSSIYGVSDASYKLKDRIFYWNSYTDTVFSILPDLTEETSFIISPGEHRYPRSRSVPVNPYEKYMVLNSIFETSRYIVIRYYFKREILLLYDKKDKKSFLIYLEFDRNIRLNGIINDLDGGSWFFPESYFTENGREYMIGLQYPYQIKARIASDEFRNSNPKYPEKKKELEKLANSLKETDNPVLMLVRLKK
jgi:hypothetical protein